MQMAQTPRRHPPLIGSSLGFKTRPFEKGDLDALINCTRRRNNFSRKPPVKEHLNPDRRCASFHVFLSFGIFLFGIFFPALSVCLLILGVNIRGMRSCFINQSSIMGVGDGGWGSFLVLGDRVGYREKWIFEWVNWDGCAVAILRNYWKDIRSGKEIWVLKMNWDWKWIMNLNIYHNISFYNYYK